MTSSDKRLYPFLDFKINQIPQQLLLPESKIIVSGAKGGAGVLVGDHIPVAPAGRKVETWEDTHRHTYHHHPGKTPEAEGHPPWPRALPGIWGGVPPGSGHQACLLTPCTCQASCPCRILILSQEPGSKAIFSAVLRPWPAPGTPPGALLALLAFLLLGSVSTDATCLHLWGWHSPLLQPSLGSLQAQPDPT